MKIVKSLLIGVGLLAFGWLAYGVVLYFLKKDLFVVSSPSMEPTLIVGDTIRLDSKAYVKEPPQAGDLVVIRDPQSPDQSFVFRVVAVPGQRLYFDKNRLTIDDEVKTGHAVSKLAGFEEFTETLGNKTYTVRYRVGSQTFFNQPVLMRSGDYFLAGDNRDSSRDSRYFGPVQTNMIVGRVVKIEDSKNKARIGKEL